jgi:hypothetical protein
MFVRFVVGADVENVFWLTGVFTESYALIDEGVLYAFEVAYLQSVLEWFDEHLPCPPFRAKFRAGKWSDNAVCWFRDDAGEPIKHIWDLVAFLKEQGRPVRITTTKKPGKIVYSDQFQIVAETPYWA